MAKDKKSTFPGSLRDHKDAVREPKPRRSAPKIDEAFGKLAKKMRERADKAKSKMKRRGSLRSAPFCCDASSCMRMQPLISKNACSTSTAVANPTEEGVLQELSTRVHRPQIRRSKNPHSRGSGRIGVGLVTHWRTTAALGGGGGVIVAFERTCSGTGRRAGAADSSPLDLYDDRVMQQAVEERGGPRRIAEHLAPSAKPRFEVQDHRAPLVARVDKLEEQVAPTRYTADSRSRLRSGGRRPRGSGGALAQRTLSPALAREA